MKELYKKEVFNPSFNTTVLFIFGVIALVILLLFKYSLVYQAASDGDFGTVAALELPSILSSLSSSSTASLF